MPSRDGVFDSADAGRADVVGGLLDDVRDRVTVRRGRENRLEDQHVERALQHVAPLFFARLRHRGPVYQETV